MSEFSGSIHILDMTQEEIKKLLNEEHIPAVLLGSNGRTISVLIPWDMNSHKLLHNRTKCIDYQYAEDHGVFIECYDHGTMSAYIRMPWGDNFCLEEDECKTGVTEEIAQVLSDNGFISAASIEQFTSLLTGFNPDDWENREQFIDSLGEHLGLYGFRWLSYNYFINDDRAVYEFNYPDLVVVE